MTDVLTIAIRTIFNFEFATTIRDLDWLTQISVTMPYCCLLPLRYLFSLRPYLVVKGNSERQGYFKILCQTSHDSLQERSYAIQQCYAERHRKHCHPNETRSHLMFLRVHKHFLNYYPLVSFHSFTLFIEYYYFCCLAQSTIAHQQASKNKISCFQVADLTDSSDYFASSSFCSIAQKLPFASFLSPTSSY